MHSSRYMYVYDAQVCRDGLIVMFSLCSSFMNQCKSAVLLFLYRCRQNEVMNGCPHLLFNQDRPTICYWSLYMYMCLQTCLSRVRSLLFAALHPECTAFRFGKGFALEMHANHCQKDSKQVRSRCVRRSAADMLWEG